VSANNEPPRSLSADRIKKTDPNPRPSSGFSAGIGQQQPSGQLSNAVHVTFTPKKAQPYEAIVRILPDHAAPIQLLVKGTGSYNERLL
jgi:hypothetical protein